MDPQQLLDQMVDVYAPSEISWWPLAPGWWIVIVLTCLILCSAIFAFVRHRKNTLWKRQALNQLKSIQAQYEAETTEANLIPVIHLIKLAFQSKYQDNKILTSTGADFIDTVNSHSGTKCSITLELETLILPLYTKQEIEFNRGNFENIRKWIKSL